MLMLNKYGQQRDVLYFLVSACVVSALFAFQGHIGFSLKDEGYLWYGAQRVMLGEVPIRDFLSYDPGRYYWSAIIMKMLGSGGIIQLRIAIAAFQFIGLYFALRLIFADTKKQDILLISICILTLILWMYPRHKLFEVTVSILLVHALARVIREPTERSFFIGGVVVGLAAVFGRNHGVYGVLGFAAAFVWFVLTQREKYFHRKLLKWVAGILVGYSPVIVMCLAVPGFYNAFLASIYFYLFEIEGTNLPLPIPWPWLALTRETVQLRHVMIGIFFVTILLFSVFAVLYLIRMRKLNKSPSPVFYASAFLTLPYAHHAFARAAAGHLAQAIFPLLIGMLVYIVSLPGRSKYYFSGLLLVCSAVVMYPMQDGVTCSKCMDMNIGGSTIKVSAKISRFISDIRALDRRYARDENILVAPYWPGVYALFEQRSPMWEIYALFPRRPDFEAAEINRIKSMSPALVLIGKSGIDGRANLKFSVTHPLIFKYISDNYYQLPDRKWRPYFVFVRRKT